RYFRPEFINRLDEVIVFRPLTKEDLNIIVEFEVGKVTSRLKEQGLELVLDQKAKDFLIDKGYNPDFGARPLRRAIGQFIEDPLSEGLLLGDFKGKKRINVTRKDEADHLYFDAHDAPKEDTADGNAVSASAEST
ncbi:MAG: ATP-dependent Clp protease ATP-binding subunit, partial [Phycisphaerales bacterium]